MKAESLTKNKKIINMNCYYSNEIESAVCWLKKKVQELNGDKTVIEEEWDLIDEAFPCLKE